MSLTARFSVAVLALALTGCVSLSDYRRLEADFEGYRSESEARQAALEARIDAFTKGYDPALHDTLERNLELSEASKARMLASLAEMQALAERMSRLAAESAVDRQRTADNARASASENVVNEFVQLRARWDAALLELGQSSAIARESAAKAQAAATQAAEKAGAAQKAADFAAQSARSAEGQAGAVKDVQKRVADLEAARAADLQADAANNVPKRLAALEAAQGGGGQGQATAELAKRIADLEAAIRRLEALFVVGGSSATPAALLEQLRGLGKRLAELEDSLKKLKDEKEKEKK